MKKKILAILLSVCLLLGMFPAGMMAAAHPFVDVNADAYFYEPVLWAAEKGITAGTSANTFSPDNPCTRAQIVTFLWRSFGSPEPNAGKSPFTDLEAGQYYIKPVLWAVENNITAGTSATTFSPNEPCTRAQIVTFLWRSVGSPEPGSNQTPFIDLEAGAYYTKPVLWAVENGVTAGTSANTFSPNEPCTRGQIVTFLYRTLYQSYTPEAPDTPNIPDTPNPPAEPNYPAVPTESIAKTETIKRTVVPTIYDGGADWRYEVNLHNSLDEKVSLKKITCQNLVHGVDVGDPYIHIVAGSELEIRFDLVADPGETIWWCDDHPVTYLFNGRRYTLELESASGKKYTKTYILDYTYNGWSDKDAENAKGFGETGEQVTLLQPGDRWDCIMWFYNNTDKTLSLKEIICWDYLNGVNDRAPYVHSGTGLDHLFVPKELVPGQYASFHDGHPYVDYFDERLHQFVYEDEDGKEYIASVRVKYSTSQYHPELNKTYPDFSGDKSKDAYTLRHDASFNVEIVDDVYWVPANVLGKSSYTNAQIQSMLTKSPEEKQASIDTLHEALQLFQIGSFYGSDDNVRIQENGYQWEHHKPGYHSVRTNHGCCASVTSWLTYILKDDYDEVGMIHTSYADGSGHVFNYIKEGDWYYFVDLTKWYAENPNVNAVESGTMSDYYASDHAYGNIHRTKDPKDFAKYLLESEDNPPGLIYMENRADAPPLDSVWMSTGVEVILAEGSDINLLYDNPGDTLTYRWHTAPVKNKDWSKDEAFKFNQMKFK